MIRALATFAPPLLLSACSAMPNNPLDRATPPSTVARIAEHHDSGGSWLGRRLLAQTPTTLRVVPSAPAAADADAAIAQYEALIDLADDPRLRAEALQRAAELRLHRADAGDGRPEDVARAIALYTRLLAEHPQHPRRDRALYQLARAQQLSGREAQATALLRQLGADHPDSPRAADALFRAAELLYQSREHAAAAATYRAVLDADDAGAYYEPAQYKYAWALYQTGAYAPALDVLMALLARDLPAGPQDDPEAALAGVDPARADRTADALRLAGLCFSALGGGRAVGEQLARVPAAERLDALLHAALAQQLLGRERYQDAAETYAAFIARRPQHPRAPEFQARIVDIHARAGFGDLMLAAVRDYAERYAPDAPYWGDRAPDAAATARLRSYLDDLARHERARAQAAAGETQRAGNLSAAHWFGRLLQLYPDDPQHLPTRLLYADALLDGGEIEAAATQYRALAFGEEAATFAQAGDAAHAAVLATRRLVDASAPERRELRLRAAVDTALALAERYPGHPQRVGALAAAAVDLFELGDRPRATAVAQQVLDSGAPAALARIAWSVIADARFADADFAGAEQAYGALLPLIEADTAEASHTAATERLAASIYRQGEAARERGTPGAAAAHFLRVAQRAPQASIVATSEYDAAAALIDAADWRGAAATLERFRVRFEAHPLATDADRKLALAYDRLKDPARSAPVYERLARRESESATDRRIAAWRAAQRYDEAHQPVPGARAWARYVAEHPLPLEAAVEARQRLADLSAGRDPGERLRWLKDIVAAEQGAGHGASTRVRALAAQAQLQIGRAAAEDAAAVALTLPIERSLPSRVAATRAAVDALTAAAAYGFSETTTAATWELATVYRTLGAALLSSPRPRNLDALALDQYQLLLEEQAYPFEEQAIRAHETNLARVERGVWDEWVGRSVAALRELAPARYGKHEQREVRYDSPT